MARYRNNYPHEIQGLGGFLKWRWEARGIRHPRDPFPLAANDPAFLARNRSESTLTWVGHATLLLQHAGLNLLTDPHFSGCASPLAWIGPRRVTPPGLALDDLPPIDLVLISHNHYDHLDRRSVERLARRPGAGETEWLVPTGLRRTLARFGARRVRELGWWESAELNGGWTAHAVPVQHASARSGPDYLRTLWAGWMVERPGFRFLFVGDTGYSPDFLEIRRRLGPPDLAALPIGAYEPRWFMRAVHANPEEAVRIHLDLESRYSVALHWGTFSLTDEPLAEPPERLAAARAAAGLEPERFMVLQHGETRRLDFL